MQAPSLSLSTATTANFVTPKMSAEKNAKSTQHTINVINMLKNKLNECTIDTKSYNLKQIKNRYEVQKIEVSLSKIEAVLLAIETKYKDSLYEEYSKDPFSQKTKDAALVIKTAIELKTNQLQEVIKLVRQASEKCEGLNSEERDERNFLVIILCSVLFGMWWGFRNKS